MAIQINGDGTITGISVGGLPDGIVDTDMIAADAVNDSKIASLFSSGAINIGGLRIQTGSFSTGTSTDSSTSSLGYSCVKYKDHIQSNVLSGFASAPTVTAELASDYHEAKVCTVRDVTTTGFRVMITAARDAGIQNRTVTWIAIGEAS